VSVPAASVVIPTRNRRHEVERAIRSVWSQTLTDWELIVVDDASTDDTWQFLTRLDDPRIRVERLGEHAERSVARNRGLQMVSSPAVLFLDDDDELLPVSLELLTRALGRGPTLCASVGAAIDDVDGVRRRPPFPKRAQVLGVRLELLAGWVALGGQSLMRAELLREAGGWREGLSVAEDQELWLRLCSCGPVATIPEAVLIHRPHGLAGDVPGYRDVERGILLEHLDDRPDPDGRAARAAAAREHLRDAYVAFESGAYRSALWPSLRGVVTAPFLLASPLVGPGIAKGLLYASVAAVLPRAATGRLRDAVRRRRARAH
jgi:glycosyltransferase involved in cell wall biosynthesis